MNTVGFHLFECFFLLIILGTSGVVRLQLISDKLNNDEFIFLTSKSPFGKELLREFRRQAHPPSTYILMKPAGYY